MLTIRSVEIRFAFYKEIEDVPGTYQVDEYETVLLDRETEKGKSFIDEHLSDDTLLSDIRWGGCLWEACPREDTDDVDEIDIVWLHFDEDGKPYADFMSYGPDFTQCRVFCDAGHTDVFDIKDPTEDKTVKNLKSVVVTAVDDLRALTNS